MGLFSGIFGGGGSKSAASTTVKVKVNPVIQVNNDLTPVQKAIEQISGIQTMQFEQLREDQAAATAINAITVGSFVDTLKDQQLLALIALGGFAIWILNR